MWPLETGSDQEPDMPSVKITKTAVETAKPASRDYELRDTSLAGFRCKVTPAGRKVFMLQYRTPKGSGASRVWASSDN